jgi:hypothetical protein
MSLKVPKKKVPLKINFVGGESIQGNIFLSSQSPLHYGEELVIDLLNDKDPFFPFEIEEPFSIRIINKKNIISVTTSEDLKSDEVIGKKEKIKIILTDGQQLIGELIINQPEYKSRVLDFFNVNERRFFELFNKSEVYYININHISQVIPL